MEVDHAKEEVIFTVKINNMAEKKRIPLLEVPFTSDEDSVNAYVIDILDKMYENVKKVAQKIQAP